MKSAALTDYSTHQFWDRLISGIPATYVVWYNTEDSKWYAECNIKGGTDYSGASPSTVTQAAIDAVIALGKGKIVVRDNMTITTGLTLTSASDVHLEFQCRITLGAEITALYLYGCIRCTIINLDVDLAGYNGVGLQVSGSWHNKVRGVYIDQNPGLAKGSAGYGIKVCTIDATYGTYFNSFYDIEVVNCDYGLYLQDTSAGATLSLGENYFTNVHTTACKTNAFYIGCAGASTFTHLSSQSHATNEITLYLDKHATQAVYANKNTFIDFFDTDHTLGTGYSIQITNGVYNNVFIGGAVTAGSSVNDLSSIGYQTFIQVSNLNTVAKGIITVASGTTGNHVHLTTYRFPWQKHVSVACSNWGLGNATKWYFYLANPDELHVAVDQDPGQNIDFSYQINLNNQG